MKKLLLLSLLFIGCAESPCGNPVSVKEFNRLQEIKKGLDSLQKLSYKLYMEEGYDWYLDKNTRREADSFLTLVKGLSYWNTKKREEIYEKYYVYGDSFKYYHEYPTSYFEQTIAKSFDSIQLIQKCIVSNSSKAYIDFDRAIEFDSEYFDIDKEGKKEYETPVLSDYSSEEYKQRYREEINPNNVKALSKAKELLSEFYNNQ